MRKRCNYAPDIARLVNELYTMLTSQIQMCQFVTAGRQALIIRCEEASRGQSESMPLTRMTGYHVANERWSSSIPGWIASARKELRSIMRTSLAAVVGRKRSTRLLIKGQLHPEIAIPAAKPLNPSLRVPASAGVRSVNDGEPAPKHRRMRQGDSESRRQHLWKEGRGSK